MSIIIKTPEEIEKMRVAGQLAADVLEMIAPYMKAGITTEELDQICHDYIVNVQQAIPAPLNYHGFPKSTCISINHVVCHGIPSADKKLKEGDIVNMDITVIKDGYHGDTSQMFIIGKGSILAERLCRVAQECLYLAIKMVKPGVRLGDFAAAIQKHAKAVVILLSGNIAGTVSVKAFMKSRKFCTMAKPALVPLSRLVCVSPSNR
jgi:methionine aminopeptidase, type I